MRQPKFKFGDVVRGISFGNSALTITSIRWSEKLETYLYAENVIGMFEYREHELEYAT